MSRHTCLLVPTSYSARVHLPELYLLEWASNRFGVDALKLRETTYLRNCSYSVYTLINAPHLDWMPRHHLIIQGPSIHVSILMRSLTFLRWLNARVRNSQFRNSVVVVESIYKAIRPELSVYQNLYPFWLRYRLVNDPIDIAKMKQDLSGYLLTNYGNDLSNIRLGNLPKSLFGHLVEHYSRMLHGFCFVIPPDVQPPVFNLSSNLIIACSENSLRYSDGENSLSTLESSAVDLRCFIESVITHDITSVVTGSASFQTVATSGIGEWLGDDDELDDDVDEEPDFHYLQQQPTGFTQRTIKHVPSYAEESKGYVTCQGSSLLVDAELVEHLTTSHASPHLFIAIVQIAKPCAHQRTATILARVKLKITDAEAGLATIKPEEPILVYPMADLSPSKIYLCLLNHEPVPKAQIDCSELVFLAHLFSDT